MAYKDASKLKLKLNQQNRVGLIFTCRQTGEKYTVIEYNDSRNCKIQFSDGTIVNNRWDHIEKGIVRNPNNPQTLYRSLVGQTKVMKNGLTATIIKRISEPGYKGCGTVLVRFSDGSEHETSVVSFKRGEATPNPNRYGPKFTQKYLNKQYKSYGLKYKISGETGKYFIISWEDGATTKTAKKKFAHNENFVCRHPNMNIFNKTVTLHNFHGFCGSLSCVTPNNYYYKVTHEDGFTGLLTMEEMLRYGSETVL